MKDSISKYFKVGLIHFMAYPATMRGEGPIVETMKKIALDDYFDAVEVTTINSDETRAQVRDMLAVSHMTVCYGAQPRLMGAGLNSCHLDENERKKAEDMLLKSVDEAEYLGAKGIAFLAGKWEEATKEESYAQLLKTTKNVCDYAKTKGMNVEIEVFDFDFDKASLIGPAPLAARFAADMREYTNNFGLLVDLSHFPQTYETSGFVFRTLRPYITHLHIGSAVMGEKSNAAYGDTHPRFGFPNGCNDIPEVLDFLRVAKNEGFFNSENPMVLSFEVKPWGNEDPDIVVANAKRVLNRAWALLED
ncbi:sugar phosphate isomerase/epimerase family protein [Caproiciproducens sp. R1]|uniref:sugar phosphate isomerase/epimerase family protein n=1 Tax=Caproiciproducens sp. R1 TaxID=3435000 RepID=UPI004034515E